MANKSPGKNKPKKQTNIEKRRRLSELYVKGEEVRFNEDGVVEDKEDQTDDDIIVWVQPPDPLQREEAVRAASAAKARTQIAARDPESRVSLETDMYVGDLDPGDLRNYLVDAQTRDVRSRAMRDVLGREEWEDFTALQDSMREWEEAGFPETDEWQPLIERDKEYGQQIQERIKEIIEDTRAGLDLLGDEEVMKRARKRYVESVANQSFMQAYEIHMLFFACRDDEDHRELFFGDIDELKGQEEFVQIALAEALSKFINDPAEAKNSRRAVRGSEQSEPPEEQETSEASTPEKQSA